MGERLGVRLDDGEATTLALHLVNAQFASTDLAPTVRMTRTITQILGVVSAVLGVRVDEQAMSTARFATHLRYLFVRLEGGSQISDSLEDLVTPIRQAQPLAFRAATRVRAAGGQRAAPDRCGAGLPGTPHRPPGQRLPAAVAALQAVPASPWCPVPRGGGGPAPTVLLAVAWCLPVLLWGRYRLTRKDLQAQAAPWAACGYGC